MSFGTGRVFSPQPNHPLVVSFPYTSRDASGTVTQQVFTSGAITPYANLGMLLNAINIEVGSIRHFGEVRVSGYSDQGAAVRFSFGYGYNLYADPFYHGRERSLKEQALVIKPSLSIGCNLFGTTGNEDARLGSIDNEDKYITALGNTYNPTRTVRATRTSSAYTENVHTLDVYYAQNEWILLPKLTFGNNPFVHIFHWEASIGYCLPFFEEGGIRLLQDGLGSTSDHLIGLKTSALTATSGNTVVTTAPYRFGGLYLGVNAGFNIVNIHQARKGKKQSNYPGMLQQAQ
jgi:hypothetical protein